MSVAEVAGVIEREQPTPIRERTARMVQRAGTKVKEGVNAGNIFWPTALVLQAVVLAFWLGGLSKDTNNNTAAVRELTTAVTALQNNREVQELRGAVSRAEQALQQKRTRDDLTLTFVISLRETMLKQGMNPPPLPPDLLRSEP